MKHAIRNLYKIADALYSTNLSNLNTTIAVNLSQVSLFPKAW
jgi:hypothetical protein